MASDSLPDARPRLRGVIAFQALLVVAAGALGFLPPEEGPMLIVPLVPGTGAAAVVTHGGGTLVATGPFPGSLYVAARRDALLPAALTHGMLLLGGNPQLCSSSDGISRT